MIHFKFESICPKWLEYLEKDKNLLEYEYKLKKYYELYSYLTSNRSI